VLKVGESRERERVETPDRREIADFGGPQHDVE
jgi:hypothetical protein